MSVAREHAERIAHLARLEIEPAELDRITTDLNHILEHVEVLRTLGDGAAADGSAGAGGSASEWEGVHPVTGESTTRGEGAERPDALRVRLDSLAPDFREGFFVVPPLPGTQHEVGRA
jgi:Asp-tRNA(Asn)/Glu-tRNA(Gln) amidotransferase C subunit